MNSVSWLLNPETAVVAVASALLGWIVRGALVPYLDGYSRRKGENLATKEDIAQLTKIAEGIKAEISDRVWDRQEKWKLKRDLLIEVIRVLGEYTDALKSLIAIHSCPASEDEDWIEFQSRQLQNEAKDFENYDRKFFRTMYVARLVIGKELHRALTECATEMRSISRKILNEELACIKRSDSEPRPRKLTEFDSEVLVQKIMPAILLARRTLEIEMTE